MSEHAGHEVDYRRFYDPNSPSRITVELFCLTCGALERHKEQS